ncbi:MAG: hypothetical protein U0350_36320 [Caldilineaceae bacterium]
MEETEALTQSGLELDENRAYKVAFSYGRVADGLKALNEVVLNAVKFLRALNDEPILMNQIHMPIMIDIGSFSLHISISFHEKH